MTARACATLCCLILQGGCAPGPGQRDGDDTADPGALFGEDRDQGSTAHPPTPPQLVAIAQAFPHAGSVPLTVDLRSKASLGARTLTHWDLGDGHGAWGEWVQHSYLSAGSYRVTLEIIDRFGQRDQETLTIDVARATCPSVGEASELGLVEYSEIDEASGLVDSRLNPGVLWVHNDSGDGPFLYALSHSGAHLGVWEIDGISARDWEDLAAGRDPITGEHLLYVGDIGDNGESRDSILVYRLAEPLVSVDGDDQGGLVTAAVLELDYPNDTRHNAETLMVDPVTDDIYIVTKSYQGDTGIFRKPAPHSDGERVTLEEVAWLDFSADPLSGNATTGGAFSPLGDRLAIRTYGTTAYVWLRDGADSMEQVLASEPCALSLPGERQSESLEFTVDGDALLSISEGTAQPINHIPLLR